MRKILVIFWTHLSARLVRPIWLVLSLGVPILIAGIIQLSFDDFVLNRGVPESDIRVGIINLDTGGAYGNLGTSLLEEFKNEATTGLLPENSFFSLFSIQEFSDEASARVLVDAEELIALLVIPADFSAAVESEQAVLTTYTNDRFLYRAEAFNTQVRTLAGVITSGEIAVRTTIDGMLYNPQIRYHLERGEYDEDLKTLAHTAVLPETGTIQIVRTPSPEQPPQLAFARYLAVSIAVLFAGLGSAAASATLLQEKGQGTLRRMLQTPTTARTIIAGRVLDVYAGAFIQLVTLILAIVLFERALDNVPPNTTMPIGALLALALALLTATTGLGILIASLAKTQAYARQVGIWLLLIMGLAGGVFFPVSLYPAWMMPFSKFTFQYWAMDAYTALSLGGAFGSILPNLFALIMMGLVFGTIGVTLFQRKLVN